MESKGKKDEVKTIMHEHEMMDLNPCLRTQMKGETNEKH